MAPPAVPGRGDHEQPLDSTDGGGVPLARGHRLAALTWAFVGLGVLLRVGRYALDFPLWWDEAFVAVNLLRRGYLDLLRPLDYGQVCPPLFLWVELAAVRLLGFSSWSLRFFPLACGVGSVFLFRHAAGRVLSGVPLLLATAIFAVSFYPIRHAADVKPYASDLLAALVLLALAIEWLREPERPNWLWALAAAGPVAVALSHPAAFVAGGVGLALAPAAWRTDRLGVRAALAAFGLATVGAFAALFVACTGAQARATLPAMRPEWAASFPPLDGPLALGRWLVATHTGNLFAYPCGAARGVSTLTFSLCVVAAVALWRRGRTTVLAACLMPFGLGLVAAAMRRYPYGGAAHGGSTRFMQYLAPGICLLAGLGAATVLGWLPYPRRRLILLRAVLVALVAVGIVPLAQDLARPYRSVHARRSRQFARDFWPALARDAEVACLRWDLGVGAWDSIHLDLPVALCNQAIYSPQRRRGGPLRDAITPARPLRCVLCAAQPEEGPAVSQWLGSMRTRYDLRRSEAIVVNMAEPGARTRPERYLVFEFVPLPSAGSTSSPRTSRVGPGLADDRPAPRLAAIRAPLRGPMLNRSRPRYTAVHRASGH